MLTSVPSRENTEPSSIPITPAPTIVSLFGIFFKFYIPVELTIFSSSIFMSPSEDGSDPVAIITLRV